MFSHEGPIQTNNRGQAVGPCIIAKDEAEDMYATKLMGSGWHEFKSYPFGEPNPDLLQDYDWISADEVRVVALQAEVGIVWC